jgi:hypothetical protein
MWSHGLSTVLFLPFGLGRNQSSMACVFYFLSSIFDCSSFYICLIGLILEEPTVIMYSDLGMQVWTGLPARICSLILSEDPAIFLLKEMSLLQVYLLYVLMVSKKNMIFIHIYSSLLWTICWMQQMLLLCCTCVICVWKFFIFF